LKNSFLAGCLSKGHGTFVNLIFVSFFSPRSKGAASVPDLLTLQVGKDDLLIDTDLHWMRKRQCDSSNYRDQGRLQITGFMDFFMAVGRRSIRGLGMVGVQANGFLMADLLPVSFHKLSLSYDWLEGVRVGTHFIVNHLVSLHTNSPDYIMTFLILVEFHTLSTIFLFTLCLQGGDTNLSSLFNVIKTTLFTIVRGLSMGWWSMV